MKWAKRRVNQQSHITSPFLWQARSFSTWGRRRVKQRRGNKGNCRNGKGVDCQHWEGAGSSHQSRQHLWRPSEACTVSDYVVWKEAKIFKGHGVMIKRRKTGSSHSARGEEKAKECCYLGKENLFITGNKAPFSFSFNCLLFICVSDSIHHFDSRSQHPAI